MDVKDGDSMKKKEIEGNRNGCDQKGMRISRNTDKMRNEDIKQRIGTEGTIIISAIEQSN